jgi:ComF family protein
MLDVVLPPRCGGCRRLGSHFCEHCWRALERLRLPVCRYCGCPVEEAGQGCWCQPATRAALAGVRAAAYYEGPLRHAIHRLKYNSQTSLASALAPLLAECWHAHDLAADGLVPVPLARERQRQRGYNQSALLARALAEQIGVPVVTGAVARVRHAPAQAGASWGERWENVAGAFAAPARKAARVDGRRLALVDDVCTTGATVAACAEALRAAGASEVWAVALARPRRKLESVVQ